MVLGREVVVAVPEGNASCGRDHAHGGCLVAVLAKEVQRYVEYPFACPLSFGTERRGYGKHHPSIIERVQNCNLGCDWTGACSSLPHGPAKALVTSTASLGTGPAGSGELRM